MKWPRAGLPAGKERSLARLTSANRQSTSPGIPHDQGADGGVAEARARAGNPSKAVCAPYMNHWYSRRRPLLGATWFR